MHADWLYVLPVWCADDLFTVANQELLLKLLWRCLWHCSFRVFLQETEMLRIFHCIFARKSAPTCSCEFSCGSALLPQQKKITNSLLMTIKQIVRKSTAYPQHKLTLCGFRICTSGKFTGGFCADFHSVWKISWKCNQIAGTVIPCGFSTRISVLWGSILNVVSFASAQENLL